MSWNYKYMILLSVVLLIACNRDKKVSPVRKSIQEAVFASGALSQENEFYLAAGYDGVLKNVNYKEGESIQGNAVFATIEHNVQRNQLEEAQLNYKDAQFNSSAQSLQLKQLNAQIEQAKAQEALDYKNYLRYKELREQNSVSALDFEKAELQYKTSSEQLQLLQSQYLDMEKTLRLAKEKSLSQLNSQKKIYDDYFVKSDKPGIVLNVYKKEGELVKRGEIIAKIGSGSYLAKLFIAEDDIVKIRNGQRAAIQLNTYPDELFEGHITKIWPAFDETEQSYVVEARFEQMPKEIFSGTQLQANIELEVHQNVMVIPIKALIKGKYVKLENGEEIEVQTGYKNEEWIEIKSGLKDNDVLIEMP
ncbi:efflux RND transporter periplasmic adaptor subunit [Flavobacterium sp. NRK F10]|uniref:efflux RND transporter periplasmic adaptor subunit n=1 Tax=Flavobacterium sp. NRK F10 TaxID=2954931 RepID=UPI0020919A94|nr:HlyD family efflux transporter periplasmic adaptor subunit [Flavobacterium sp. NRK F10]MCO6176427.1 efflux RND transporter periplasmic adaptor subunit [Flavobacterium sp. NRK F10]